MIEIKIPKKPYDEDVQMFSRSKIQINEGLTVLVGCNGYGKSTVQYFLKDQFKDDPDADLIQFDGRTDKNTIRQRTMNMDIEFFSQFFGASEGEEICLDLSYTSGIIGTATRHSEKKKLFILLDAIDSGYSIDNIIEFKRFLRELVFPDMKQKGAECYVVVSANSYEMAADEDCVDVGSGNHIKFKDYEEYKEFILKTREIKDNR